MKRGLWIMVLLCLSKIANSATLALVYENDAAVLAGKPSLGTVVADGVIVPSQVALAGGSGLVAGELGEKLRRAALVRLDNDLNLALVRLGDEIFDAGLQSAFQARSVAVTGFLPAAPASGSIGQSNFLSTRISTSAFIVKINGQDVDAGPVSLKSSLKKSKFKLEIVAVSTEPAWNFGIELKSSPKLSFWKEGRKMGLNDVPTPTFTYRQQLMFKPMKEGDSFKVPVEVFFINEKEYIWTFRINTKIQSMGKTVQVKFN